jgi:hypothetical protein
MVRHVFLPFVAVLATAAAAQEPVAIDVRFSPRVELLCVLFRLAGNPEYNQARVPAYADAVDAWFAGFRDHAAVQRARALRQRTGVSYDAVMSMAIHLPPDGSIAGAISFAPRPAALDRRWPDQDTREFLREAQQFVADSRFDDFLAEHHELHELTVRRLRAALDAGIEMDWFPRFFGARPAQSFTVIPGLLNGGGSYGPRVVRADGTEELYSILGTWLVDGDGKPRFDASIVDTVVHEFCHSFCNPIVEAHRERLRGAGEQLWPFVADTMRAQAYGNWETMMKETLVRVCTARYVLATRGEREHERAVDYEHGRGFEWTAALSERLGAYELDRAKFATLDAFVPELAARLETFAAEFAAAEAKRPHVVALVPANGAQDVDPGITAIVVTFDRPMRDRSWSVVGGGPRMPKLAGEPSYDAARQVLTIPVALQPGTSYEFGLNSGRHMSFRSADGAVLRPVRVTFRTR